jgi:hypothetical protein
VCNCWSGRKFSVPVFCNTAMIMQLFPLHSRSAGVELHYTDPMSVLGIALCIFCSVRPWHLELTCTPPLSLTHSLTHPPLALLYRQLCSPLVSNFRVLRYLSAASSKSKVRGYTDLRGMKNTVYCALCIKHSPRSIVAESNSDVSHTVTAIDKISCLPWLWDDPFSEMACSIFTQYSYGD